MYLSNFEARAFLTESLGGKSACVHGRECLFFSTAEKSRRKTDDSNFRIRANKILRVVPVLKATIKQSDQQYPRL